MNLRLVFTNAVIFLTLCCNLAMAQDIKVSGKVRNKSNGEPLIGATVTIKGTDFATVTDALGQFSINVSEKGATLLFSYTGFKTVPFSVKSKTSNIDILMEDANGSLNEVVVVGYGTKKEKIFQRRYLPFQRKKSHQLQQLMRLKLYKVKFPV
jgi:phosphorylcholine metabolism protein LicD